MPTAVTVALSGPVATLKFESPDALHVLSRAALAELEAALQDLSARSEVRALILTGSGKRAFSAGADLSELAELTPGSAFAYAAYGQGIAQAITRFPVPTFAALNGPAFGGGVELALACDFRLAAPGARLHYQAAKLGLLPGWGGTQRLPLLVGPARAKAMMLLSRPVEAATALEWGLVDAVDADLPGLVAHWTADAAGADRQAGVQIKRALNLSARGDFASERQAFSACFAEGHAPELIRAWLNRGRVRA